MYDSSSSVCIEKYALLTATKIIYETNNDFGPILDGVLTLACTVLLHATVDAQSQRQPTIDLGWSRPSQKTSLIIGNSVVSTIIAWDVTEDHSGLLCLVPLVRCLNTGVTMDKDQINGLILREVSTHTSTSHFSRLGTFRWYLKALPKESNVFSVDRADAAIDFMVKNNKVRLEKQTLEGIEWSQSLIDELQHIEMI